MGLVFGAQHKRRNWADYGYLGFSANSAYEQPSLSDKFIKAREEQFSYHAEQF